MKCIQCKKQFPCEDSINGRLCQGCLDGRRKHTSAVSSVACCPKVRDIVSGDAEGIVKLWEVPSARGLRTVRGHTNRIVFTVIARRYRMAVRRIRATLRARPVMSAAYSQAPPVATETSGGMAVQRLLEAGYAVYPVNPKAAKRYRERKTRSGLDFLHELPDAIEHQVETTVFAI